MTVVNEEYESDRYSWMSQVELFDLIGRVAEAKFEHTDIAAEPLAKRIEYILDGLFTIIDQERIPVQVKQVDISESDDDYWFQLWTTLIGINESWLHIYLELCYLNWYL